MAQNVRRLMKLDNHDLAYAIASSADNNLTELGSTLRIAQRRLLNSNCDEDINYQLINGENVILALTFTRRSLLALQRISHCDGIVVNVLKTDVTEKYFKNYLTYYGKINLLTQSEIVTYKNNNCTRSMFVTFPDHTVGTANTNLAASMFGEHFLFQMIESWLSRKHAANIFMFDGESFYKHETSRGEVSDMSADIMGEIQWIAKGVEKAVNSAPEEYYAWSEIARKLCSNVEHRSRAQVNVLKGALHTWITEAPRYETRLLELLDLIDTEATSMVDNIARPTIYSVGWQTT